MLLSVAPLARLNLRAVLDVGVEVLARFGGEGGRPALDVGDRAVDGVFGVATNLMTIERNGGDLVVDGHIPDRGPHVSGSPWVGEPGVGLIGGGTVGVDLPAGFAQGCAAAKRQGDEEK